MEYKLTERLRCNYNGRDFSGPAPEGMMLPSAIMLEAAAEIERLTALCDGYRGEVAASQFDARKAIICPSCGSNYTSPFDTEESDTTRRCGHCGEVFEEETAHTKAANVSLMMELGTARRRCQGYAVLLDGITSELSTVPVDENDTDPAKSALFMIGVHIATFGDRPESVLDDSDHVARLTERIDELEGLAYSNGELYNKEYLLREDAESALTRARAEGMEDASRIMKVRAANAMRRYHDGLRGEVPASVIMALPLVTEQDAAAIRATKGDSDEG